jgi:glycosyltransferase involved in cell wall biosynthesis
MLNYEFPPIGGGAGHAHLCLLKQYADNDQLEVDVLTSGAGPGLFQERFSDNISIHRVGLHKKDLHFWRKVEVIEWLVKAKSHYRRLLREEAYDLVHAFFGFPSGWLCYRTAKKLPYIVSLRGSDVPGQHARLQIDYKVLGPVFKTIWKKAAVLVACSQGLKERALGFLPSVDIEVIPNGIELDRFHPCRDEKTPDKVRLLTVGRLSVTKRVEMLIEAIETLHRQDRKVSLTIVGGGALEQDLREIVSQRELEGVVDVTGRIDSEKMPQVYRNHDLFISATMQEGMSNAMLEAMASGLPIVTTKCEGVEELIADNGIVVELAETADAVKKLMNDRGAYEQMAVAARKQAEKFGWENAAQKYIQCYEQIRQ